MFRLLPLVRAHLCDALTWEKEFSALLGTTGSQQSISFASLVGSSLAQVSWHMRRKGPLNGGEDQRIQQKRSATKRPAVHSPPQRLGPPSQWESARFFQPFFFCCLGMPLASHLQLLCSHVPVMISCLRQSCGITASGFACRSPLEAVKGLTLHRLEAAAWVHLRIPFSRCVLFWRR